MHNDELTLNRIFPHNRPPWNTISHPFKVNLLQPPIALPASPIFTASPSPGIPDLHFTTSILRTINNYHHHHHSSLTSNKIWQIWISNENGFYTLFVIVFFWPLHIFWIYLCIFRKIMSIGGLFAWPLLMPWFSVVPRHCGSGFEEHTSDSVCGSGWEAVTCIRGIVWLCYF